MKCDMTRECGAPVTHMDEKGFLYCTPHGEDRKFSMRCRKLAKWEARFIAEGKPIRYERGPMPKGVLHG